MRISVACCTEYVSEPRTQHFLYPCRLQLIRNLDSLLLLPRNKLSYIRRGMDSFCKGKVADCFRLIFCSLVTLFGCGIQRKDSKNSN
jgi:hypothetical protein